MALSNLEKFIDLGFSLQTDFRGWSIGSTPVNVSGTLAVTPAASLYPFDAPSSDWTGNFVYTGTSTSPRPNLTADGTALSHASDTLDAKQSAFDAAKAASSAADAAVVVAAAAVALQPDYPPLLMEVKKATINLATLTARSLATPPTATTADVTAAQARLDAANEAQSEYSNPAAPAYFDALDAQNTAFNAYEVALGELITARAAYAGAQATLALDTLNADSYDAANPGGGTTIAPYTSYGVAGGEYSTNNGFEFRLSPGLITAHPDTVYYAVHTYQAQYRHKISLSAEQRPRLVARGLKLVVAWNEITRSVAAKTVHVAASGSSAAYDYFSLADVDPTVSYEPKTETFDPADAVEQIDGSWMIFGETHDLAPGDLGAVDAPTTPAVNVGIGGAAILPGNTATTQSRGTVLQRQGWREYVTPTGQARARRYLTCTASAGASAPVGANYSGTLALVPVPDGGFPEGTVVIADGTPLAIVDTLSDSCGPGRQIPDSLTPDTDGATIESATARTLAAPPGLRLDLSDEQTTAMIADEAAAIRDAAWPADPPDPDAPVDPYFYSSAADLAKNYTSPDGDLVIGMRMRFKLSYSAGDSRLDRDNTFTVTHRWAYKRTNLDTLEVTLEPYSRDIEYPVAQVITHEDGTTTTTTSYETADTDWTEVAAGDNESVELVMLPGVNTAPHSFGGIGFVVPALVESA